MQHLLRVLSCTRYSTNKSNYLVNSYNVICGGDRSFTGLDTKCNTVQCPVPEISNAASQGGTTFGENRSVTSEVVYTVTGLGGDERIQTTECMATRHFSSWKQCKQVSCGLPPKEVSADIHACADSEVHYSGSVSYSCSTGHSHVASPDGSKSFTAKCESTGLFSGVKNCVVIVCDTPQERWNNGTLVESDLEPTFGHVVSYKCLSAVSVNGTPSGDAGFEAKCLATGGFEFSGEFRDIEGAFVDGHLNYTCDCNAGFDAVSISNRETCLEINECDEWMTLQLAFRAHVAT